VIYFCETEGFLGLLWRFSCPIGFYITTVQYISAIRRCKNLSKKIKEYRKTYYEEYYSSMRKKIYEMLDNRCNNPFCHVVGGETDVRCLVVVPVLLDKTKTRRKSLYDLYKHILNNPDMYELLCYNCRAIREYEYEKNVVQKSEQDKPAGKVALKEPLKRDVKEEDEEYVEQDEEWVDEEFTLDLDIVVENLLDNYLAGDSKGVGKKLDEFVVDGQIKAGQKAEVLKRLKRKKAKLV